MEPLVSVIMPTYNHAECIDVAVRSVLRQSYKAWELIIIDDGSTDDTVAVAKSAAGSDRRVRVLTCSHRGLGRLDEIYNDGLRSARGRYVAILEGDDWWPEDRLEVQMGAQVAAGATLCYGVAALWKDGRVAGDAGRPPFRGVVRGEQFLYYLLCDKAAVQPVTLCVERTAIESVGGFKQLGFVAVDLPTLLHLPVRGKDVLFVDAILGYWRQHGRQATRRFVIGDHDQVDGVLGRSRSEVMLMTLSMRVEAARLFDIGVSAEEIRSHVGPGISRWALAALASSIVYRGRLPRDYLSLVGLVLRYGDAGDWMRCSSLLTIGRAPWVGQWIKRRLSW
jgi:glycosyltransferase involved in cell wall biosynthesis